jgi:predicted ATP-grasp superfamily ATP-dependent carboligase
MTAREGVLLLDGHTNQALACVRSLGRAGYDVYVASHRRWPLASWSRFSRGAFRLAGESIPAFAAVRSWARARGVRFVLPLTERACRLCNAEREAWEQAGIVVGCGPDEMLDGAFDKAQTVARAAACGIPVPATRFPESLEEAHAAARELGFPCVVKARFSNAWDGKSFLPDRPPAHIPGPEELDALVTARRQNSWWPHLQQYVSGHGKAVSALCDHGQVVAWSAHERLREVRPTGSGSSLRRSTPLDPRLVAPAAHLLRQLNWHGPAMVEFRDDGVHAPWLMEVNGRFWGSLQLAIASGVDFPAMWVRMLGGQTAAPRNGYQSGVTLRWLAGDVKRLIHILRGPPAGYPDAFPTVRQGARELLSRQPPGTQLEVWDRRDPWPAVAEWIEAVRDLRGRGRPHSTPSPPLVEP